MSGEKKYHPPPPEKRADARSLHQHALEVLKEKALEKKRKKLLAEEERRHAYFEFMNRKFTDKDLEDIEERTGNAVHAGEFELELFRFPAWYLTDHGRAVNNEERGWPDTLTGYAASFYEAYKEIGEPQGFKIKPKVLNYPDGFIGEVGIFLRW